MIQQAKLHYTSKNLTYFSHMKRALYFCSKSLVCSVTLFIHAFLPCFFENTASNIIKELNKNI